MRLPRDLPVLLKEGKSLEQIAVYLDGERVNCVTSVDDAEGWVIVSKLENDKVVSQRLLGEIRIELS